MNEIPEKLIKETQEFIGTYAIAIIKWLSEEPEPENYPLLEGRAAMDREFVMMLITRILSAAARGDVKLPEEIKRWVWKERIPVAERGMVMTCEGLHRWAIDMLNSGADIFIALREEEK